MWTNRTPKEIPNSNELPSRDRDGDDFGWLFIETDLLGRQRLCENTYACAMQRGHHSFVLLRAGLHVLAARKIAGLPATLVQGRDALGDFNLNQLSPENVAGYAALLAHRCLIGEYAIQHGETPVSAPAFDQFLRGQGDAA